MTGKEIREKRIKLGLSQEALARELKISVATISRWELNKQKPRALYEYALNQFFEKAFKESN